MSDKERISFSHFEWSVRALAQPAAIQLALFPAFVCVTDELALEFDECLCDVSKLRGLLPPHAVSAVESLDAQLVSMSGPDHLDLWTDESLALMPEWEDVRQRALAVVAVMGWPVTSPGSSSRTYVSEPELVPSIKSIRPIRQ